MGDIAARRVFLSDRRGQNRHLRVTRHSDSRTIVFSHWVGGVCVASTSVRLMQATELVGLIVGAMREALDAGNDGPGLPKRAPAAAWLVQVLRRLLRPNWAAVIKLEQHHGATDDEGRASPKLGRLPGSS